jgi:hypothetical protein
MDCLQDQIAEYTIVRNAHRVLTESYDAQKAHIMASVQSELDELEFALGLGLDEAKAKVSSLEKQIKAQVEAGGQSVKGDYWHFVYAKGRVTWDARLEGYAVAHPEILPFKIEGKPSVSLKPAALTKDS